MKRRIRFRFYIIIIVSILALLYSYQYLFNSADLRFASVRFGEVAVKSQGEAFLSVSEEIHLVADEKTTEFFVAEGEVVQAGQELFAFYSRDLDPEMREALIEIRERILRKQLELAQEYSLDVQFNDVLSQIHSNFNQVASSLFRGNLSTLRDQEMILRDSFIFRQNFFDLAIVPDSVLLEMYTKEATLRQELQKFKQIALAEQGGVVSFFPNSNVTNNYVELNLSELESYIENRKNDANFDLADRDSVVRVIHPAQWHIVALIENRYSFFLEGDVINLRIIDTPQDSIVGEVTEVEVGESKTKLVIQMVDYVPTFLTKNIFRIEIEKKASGFLVPRDAIFKTGDLDSVRLQFGEQELSVPVKIVGIEDEYVIIRSLDNNIQLDLNSRVILR